MGLLVRGAGHLGDIAPAHVLRFMWETTAAAGSSVTRTVNGTVSVYKNADTSQSVTGVTDTEDFDGLTGIHLCAIDTSADGTFYATGGEFTVVVSGMTIDGVAGVNGIIGSFSIEARAALMPTVAGKRLDVSTGGEAGVDWANVGSPTTAVALTNTTVDLVADAVDAASLKTDAVNEIADGIMTRASSNWEATAPAKSLGTAVMGSCHKNIDAAGTRTIYRSDGVTIHASGSITTNISQDPISALGALS